MSGEGAEHRQPVSSGILRKQSWIRGLDTPAPGENLSQPTGGLIPPPPLCLWPASDWPASPRACTSPVGSQCSLEPHCCFLSSSPCLLPRVTPQSEGPCLWTPGLCLGGEMLWLLSAKHSERVHCKSSGSTPPVLRLGGQVDPASPHGGSTVLQLRPLAFPHPQRHLLNSEMGKGLVLHPSSGLASPALQTRLSRDP